MAALRLLLTADLHGRLTRGQVERLGQARREHAALLLDAGDAVTAPNVLVWPWDEPILPRMNAAGYAAMARGNREFFFRRRGMLRKTRTAQFPLLAANLRTREGGDAPDLPGYARLCTAQGDPVGVVGLAREMIPPGGAAEAFSDLRFIPWREAAQEAIAALRGEVAWLVALSHLGPEADDALAQACPEFDLVLGGHAHPPETVVRRLGRTTVVTAPPRMRQLPLITCTGRECQVEMLTT